MPYDKNIEAIQLAAKALNHDPGPLDGLWGKRTKMALESIIAHDGRPLQSTASVPPWMHEAFSVHGLHEVHDNAVLKKWLRSDGKTLGDPAALPWCGDFVETCIKNSVPDEPFEGALGENPYWARNWLYLGQPCPATMYCIGVFSRGSGGHVGFIIGEVGGYYAVYGGNQNNTVGSTKIEKTRCLGLRWPLRYTLTHYPLKNYAGVELPASVNEL